MKKGVFIAMFALVVAAFLAAPLTSYAGGSVTGKVTYNGKPEEKEFLFSKFPNPKFCPKNPKKELVKGEKRILPTIQLGPGNGLKGAVVAVVDIEDKAFMDSYKGTDVVAEFCEFMPFTGVVVKQKNFHVENHDADPDDPGPKGDFPGKKGVLHNPHTFEVLGPSSSTVFNIALAEKDSKLDKPVVLRKDKQGSVLRLQCDQHEFMQGFYLPVTNPHYTVVKDDGTFEIKDVPAGKHKIVAWHPGDGKGMRVEMEVDVPEGGKADAKIELKKK
ncbi:MAG TPA: hypothetical protein VGQ60_05300 [Nitrospiraceae bacterium]|nr:hypothetical protein [Nitrospiraceae bacterium]